MKDKSLYFLVSFLGIILILFIILKINSHPSSSEKLKERHRQVPLNYFTLKEPKYFFYDPKIGLNDEDNKPVHSYEKPYDNTVFGEDNYLRYYPDSNSDELLAFNN
jgi:hypothetical protein